MIQIGLRGSLPPLAPDPVCRLINKRSLVKPAYHTVRLFGGSPRSMRVFLRFGFHRPISTLGGAFCVHRNCISSTVESLKVQSCPSYTAMRYMLEKGPIFATGAIRMVLPFHWLCNPSWRHQFP
ncbi:MAG: hypothetical protein FJW36_26065 [Acidobacteria bacterium]|nr:hypothetical protein [Acidobacteriota bacterium]